MQVRDMAQIEQSGFHVTMDKILKMHSERNRRSLSEQSGDPVSAGLRG
jgi:hypothetical protein